MVARPSILTAALSRVDEALSSIGHHLGGRHSALPLDMRYRITHGFTADAFRSRWVVTAKADDDETLDAIQDEARAIDGRLRTWERAQLAFAMARDHGNLAYVYARERGATDLSQPIADGADVVAWDVLRHQDVWPESWSNDLDQEAYGEPGSYTLTLRRAGRSTQLVGVHASRLIRFRAMEPAPGTERHDGTSTAIVDLYEQAARSVDGGFLSLTNLSKYVAIPALSVPGIKDQATTTPGGLGHRARYMDSLRTMIQGLRHGAGFFVSTGDDKISFVGPQLAGIADLQTKTQERMSIPEGASQTKIYGVAPGGLSTNDEAGKRGDDALSEGIQEMATAPILDMYRISLGRNDTRRLIWGPLHTPTLMEQAQISLALAQRDQVLISMGIIDVEEARERHADGDEVPELNLLERASLPIGEPLPAVDPLAQPTA